MKAMMDTKMIFFLKNHVFSYFLEEASFEVAKKRKKEKKKKEKVKKDCYE